MKLALLLPFAASLLVSAADGGDDSVGDAPLLRGSGAVVASDAREDASSSFGIPEFLAEPEYCFKRCFRDCSCYSESNDCYPKCCTKTKGNCPNGNMPKCEVNQSRRPPDFDRSNPSKCPGGSSGGNGGNRSDSSDDAQDRNSGRCSDNDDCKSDSFCNLPDCGRNTREQGRCELGGRDDDCNEDFEDIDLMCGCDQRTYLSECDAFRKGVIIDDKGVCDPPNARFGLFEVGQSCRNDNDCKSDSYCKPLFGECSFSDRDGFCTKFPENKDVCDKLRKDEVCDCDGKTQRNQCMAEYDQKGVRHYGSCDGDSSSDNVNRSNRCDDNDDCARGQFCDLPRCGRDTRDRGQCVDGGENRNRCSIDNDLVCGCDQRTYGNECFAFNKGVSVMDRGMCDEPNMRFGFFEVGEQCTSDNQCARGFYCKPLFGECSVSTRDGFCTKMPENKNDCDNLPRDEVCACNGRTERNQCMAEYDKEGVRNYGSC